MGMLDNTNKVAVHILWVLGKSEETGPGHMFLLRTLLNYFEVVVNISSIFLSLLYKKKKKCEFIQLIKEGCIFFSVLEVYVLS